MIGQPWFVAAVFFYCVATAFYLGFLAGLKDRASKAANLFLTLGFVMHMCDIGAPFVRVVDVVVIDAILGEVGGETRAIA